MANFDLLQEHTNKYHRNNDGHEQFLCEECEVSFDDFTGLQQHEQEVHTETKYGCTECNFGANLYTEMLSHKFLTHMASDQKNIKSADDFIIISWLNKW